WLPPAVRVAALPRPLRRLPRRRRDAALLLQSGVSVLLRSSWHRPVVKPVHRRHEHRTGGRDRRYARPGGESARPRLSLDDPAGRRRSQPPVWRLFPRRTGVVRRRRTEPARHRLHLLLHRLRRRRRGPGTASATSQRPEPARVRQFRPGGAGRPLADRHGIRPIRVCRRRSRLGCHLPDPHSRLRPRLCPARAFGTGRSHGAACEAGQRL
ncbi:uncharacterized protein METZ01_LOCUS385766, partial [marine metagenome]